MRRNSKSWPSLRRKCKFRRLFRRARRTAFSTLLERGGCEETPAVGQYRRLAVRLFEVAVGRRIAGKGKIPTEHTGAGGTVFPGMPPIQQAREILAALRLDGSKFTVDDDLIRRLERTYGLKVAVATRKLSGRGLTGATLRIGDTLVIICPEEGGEALRGPVIAHEVAHELRRDPVIDLEAVTDALNTCPDLPFVVCDPEKELQAECTSAAIVVLARRPDSLLRRALSKVGAILFGRVPGSVEKWRDTAETHARYFDVDR